MSDAAYRNYRHYIQEGWAKEPKESFKALARHLSAERGSAPSGRLLDIGCATGELVAFLASRFGALQCTGIDVFDDLLERARTLVPGVEFTNASALDLPAAWRGRFDIVTAVGVASVFDEHDIERFWTNVLDVLAPDGVALVLSPLNEYGVDAVIRHRKRAAGRPLGWETGWNVFSTETIAEVVAARGGRLRLARFRFEQRLEPKPDPVRTWTLATERDPWQLTNGIKLLIDHYFMIVRKVQADDV